MAPPRGTPVCLMEETTDIMEYGVARTSKWELAGVTGPSPVPLVNAYLPKSHFIVQTDYA